MPDYSKNEHAEKVVGLRHLPDTQMPFDQPCELDYHCPICEYEQVTEGEFDERLDWSEYNGFLWCSVCNKDYPVVLCILHDIDRAIEIYLNCVSHAIRMNKGTKE